MLQRLSSAVVLGIAGLVLSAAPALAAADSVATGFTHSCAIKTGGTPVCWGLNSHGQTTIPPGTGSVTRIAAGFTHSCAIKTGGTPVCWGEDTDGQATAPPDSVTKITTGRYHSCAIKTDGNPVCWGENDDEQSTIPPGTGTVTEISAGGYHTCAIKADGNPTCWGDDFLGQTAIPGGTGTVTQLDAGFTHSCAIKTGGAPVCWGENSDGQTTIPPGIGNVTQVSAGGFHSCAVKTDGNPVCWGFNDDGEATIPPGSGTVTQISAGLYYTCAIKPGGAVVCWGENGSGQRGAAPAITSSPPPAGANQAYSHTVMATGTFTSTFAVTSGSLPPGLALDPVSGAITGTPTSTGTYTGTISASDSVFADATQAFSIAIDVTAPATTDNVPAGFVNHDVTVTLTAADTGGSGVARTHYTTNGSDPTAASPTYAAGSKPVLGNGQRIKYFSADNSGNAEAIRTSAVVQVDAVAPSTSITAPADGASYAQGAAVNAAYSCTDAAGGSGLSSCTGPVPDGAPADTQTPGPHTFAVTAQDGAGNTTTTTVTYTVNAPPSGGGGGGGTTTTPPPPDTTGPVVVIPAGLKTLAARSGVVLFRYGAALEDSTGVISLKSGSTLGTARFTAVKGRVIVVRIKLSAKARKTLAKRGKLKVQAAITVRDAAGNATMKTYKLTLKAAKRKR